ncbi:hypothetical protein JHK87_015700 [Glycine soja]|nr:hypothetical protein JHK87_015700 [Glycine soja]
MAQNVDPQPKKVVEQGQVDQIAQDKEINILNLHVTSNIRFQVLMEMEISVKVTPILTPQVAASDATFGTKSINRFLASPQLLGDLPQIEPIQAPPPDISPVFESPCPILEELEPTQEDQSHHPKIPELSMVVLRDKQVSQFAKLIKEDQIETGSGLNQESSITKAGDTRWGSHFRTFTSLMTIYGAIIEVLEEVGKDTSFEKYGETMLLLYVLQSFDFIFMLYLMVEILGFTNDLSVMLQKRDQDLLNVLSLVKATKEELQEMRNDGWEELISKVMEICNKHDIDVPDLDALYLHELNDRFDEDNIELLQCVSCLSPSSSFEAFDVKKLLRMVELYPNDFVDVWEVVVRHQLQNYVRNVRCDPKFVKLKGLSELCAKLVKTKKCNTFDIVYRLLKLALVLPVATASVKRVFSTMKFVKSQLCNKMDDQWLNDRLVTFIERDVLGTINNDVILAHFQKMDSRQFLL